MEENIKKLAKQAKQASYELAVLSSEVKNQVLQSLQQLLINNQEVLLAENQKDLAYAKENCKNTAFIDRLTLNHARIMAMVDALGVIIDLPEVNQKVIDRQVINNGLILEKTSTPLGVIAMIYESRPNVTIDAAALCFKSGNAVILKGGKEAIHSNRALHRLIIQALKQHQVPAGCVQFVDYTERAATHVLLQQVDYIDVVIPRGGKNLIKAITEQSQLPVIKHLDGICHTYIDATANIAMAEKIIINAKCQRPGVCNAMETLLIHQEIAKSALPRFANLLKAHGVLLKGCEQSCKIIKEIMPAGDADWSAEYLDLILSIKVIKNIDQAIAHINQYGSGHSDSIITEDKACAEQFLQQVDSAAVYHNASTRFTDGEVFGKGAEIGISTDKLHARGPVGLNELTSYKYIIRGTGQIRD
ncbi:gamma-glutamyl-phosphate reductase [Piscirickettsia salmonis]|uniref:Gamma-glutamyl phosphate reductase n=1 Tax=Piscirickettsia salmonis TaxID=1238 RepID=A0A9Q6LNG8_PISSA|nr:glutamate-5-semialdehyde dehydrogenase [Piscirickettsia salmonis]ALA25890.1 glutamate-5-semialdehyde dehydrogenase [Piscirickettsia salmonis]APS43362.1 gamma-glutamyl-phosphate reductase [Piscirickettsia salmonis]APS46713.1 gamma-glutamyl-phosphate reductase [Piscirickettsia salmonis]APS50686.1 gamma-glutamyl-phosphate reductase [Piscirickettsia salmonis]APS53890.1 gamma-glutamyl-phosphate reductase [Piscirickettsia salmonis]